MEAHVLMVYDKHKRATGVTVETVAHLGAAAAVVERDTEGHVASEVSFVDSYLTKCIYHA